jgi:hypothetical protein
LLPFIPAMMSAPASGVRLDPGVGIGKASGKRGDFHRRPVAPSIFAIGDRSNLIPEFAVGVTVEHTRRCVNLPFSDPDRNLGIVPDVLDPSSGFTCFGEQVEMLAPDHNQISISRGKPVRRPIVVR